MLPLNSTLKGPDQQLRIPNVLILYYSLSGQSRGLVNLFAAGLREEGILVTVEKISACEKVDFPFKGPLHTLKMMVVTFFRLRIPIKELNPSCFSAYNLVVLAGPTWSYNPSGPVLALLDRDGMALFAGKAVMPLISCRGYFRLHDYILRRQLRNLGASVEKSLVFNHPVQEPWSTFGVFLKSAGYHPEKMKYIRNRYSHFGHTKTQLFEARRAGQTIAKSLLEQAVSAG